MRLRFLLAIAALVLLSAVPQAQCPDPPVPQGGFALTRQINQPVTYADTARTLMDVRYPSVKPGPCGWPVIILVHGLAGTRARTAPNADFYATQGYVTVSYDVRGQGAALALNPASLGTELIGRSELLDLAEIVALVKSRFGNGIADVSRLGITGFSQGGAHSWAAAAYSGRTLPANNRGVNSFPVFKAAVPLGFPPISPEVLVVNKQAFSQTAATASALPPAVVEYLPAFQQPLLAAMAAGDTAGGAAIVTNDPWRQNLAYLKTSTVPVSVHVQWNDAFAPVDLAIQALKTMPKTTPTRAFLTALASHDEPRNVRQQAQSRAFALRWFDRFLKGRKNGIDTEPRFVTGVVPDRFAAYQDPSTLLWHRYHSSWTPAGTNRLKFYLRQGRVLSSQAPTTAEPPETIQHRVQSGWNMNRYVTSGANPAMLTQAFALSSSAYDTPALTVPVEIVGSPSVVLEVSPLASSTRYQLHCALYQVPANGPERYLQTGVAVVTGNSSTQRLTIDFADLDAYVPAGDKLRLRIENLTRRYPAGRPAAQPFNYYTIPFFVNADVAVEHTAARPSWLEIPVAQTILPALTSATLDVDTRAPADIGLGLDGTPAHAGAPYLLGFGISGISPGTVLPAPAATTALLNIDAFTTALVGALNSPLLPGAMGTLDKAGKPVLPPRIALGGLPDLRSMVGVRLNAIALVVSGNAVLASNPLDFFFR